jgi:large subunit ribosomal protein L9
MASNVNVVLRADLANLGQQGQVVRVKPGYARNYLVPRGLASIATRANVKQIEHEQDVARKRLEKQRAEQQKAANEIEKVVVMIAKEAGDEGKLYGSVTTADVAEGLARKGHQVDKRKLILPEEAIKEVGSYEVQLKMPYGVIAKIRIEVKTAA